MIRKVVVILAFLQRSLSRFLGSAIAVNCMRPKYASRLAALSYSLLAARLNTPMSEPGLSSSQFMGRVVDSTKAWTWQGHSWHRDFRGAPSRFGYLRTPLPSDASPAAQADAHSCLLDALGL